MKTYITAFIGLMAAALFLASCCTLSKRKTNREVPYTVAQRYFVKNDVAQLPNGAITTEQEFYSLFGQATAMGTDGRPTQINFQRQFVIAVTVPPTDTDTDIEPVALHQYANSLVLTYSVSRGEQRSYTIQPLLLLVVDKKYEGTVELRQQ